MKRAALFFVAVGVLLLGLSGRAEAQGRAGGVTEEEETFQAAEEAFKDNREADAARLFEKVCAINPRRAEAWTKRAVILYKARQYDEAVALLTRGRELNPDDPGLAGQLGLTLYRMGRVDEGVVLLEAAAARQPEAFQVQLQLCQHAVKVGDGKRGVLACEAYFKFRPDTTAKSDLQVRALSGTAYFLDHRYAEAERDLELVVRGNPRDAISRATLGAVYTETGAYARALATYARIPGDAARLPSTDENLARCHYVVHQFAEAERHARAFLAARPGDARGLLLLGDILAARHDDVAALESYAAARASTQDNGALIADLAAREGSARLRRHELPAARAAFEETLRRRPDDVVALVGLCETEVAAARPVAPGARNAPLVELGARVARLPGAAAALCAARAAFAGGDDAAAGRAFEHALSLDATLADARIGLARSLNRQAGVEVARGDDKAAVTRLERAAQLFPESVVVSRNLGLALLLAGRAPEAETTLLRAHERMEKDLVINRLLGRASAAQGKSEAAISYYEVAAAAGQKGGGQPLAEVLVEVGPLYAAAGRLDMAVLALESALREAGDGPLAEVAARNLAIARLRRGLDRIGEPPQAQVSLEDLAYAAAARRVLSARQVDAAGCAFALGTLKVGKPQAALDELARGQKDGGCQWKPPYDKLGAELFAAYAAYRDQANPVRLESAARTFGKLQLRVGAAPSDALAEPLKELTRSAYELAGVAYFTRGDRKKASLALRTAARLPSKLEHRELDHNLAVLDLEDGRLEAAARAFDQLGARPPEALVNLGIVRDREGESKKALDLYRRALDRGARAPHLRDWIDVKERVFARAAGPGSTPGSSNPPGNGGAR